MGKIGIIIGREYWSRVKKKSFLIMTFLGPLLMAALIILPAYFIAKSESKSVDIVTVIDDSGFYDDAFVSDEKVIFAKADCDLATAKIKVTTGELPFLLHIPQAKAGEYPESAQIYGRENATTNTTYRIESAMEEKVKNAKLHDIGIDPNVLEKAEAKIDLKSYKTDEQGNMSRSFNEINQIIGYLTGLIIYMAVYMFAAQVMRGVMEEKSSRIVEVMISSVKPFQLLMGKIVGIGLVGLTQFVLWIILTGVLVGTFGSSLLGDMSSMNMMQSNINVTEVMNNVDTESLAYEIVSVVSSLNIPLILLCFVIYFVGGYMLYASMFAAIGGAVDSEDDTNQFLLPFTIVLILPLIFLSQIINDPSGPIAMWLSMIPFTSPIAMMTRIPFDIPMWEIVVSISILVATFILMTWMSAKIYRVGNLMYGK